MKYALLFCMILSVGFVSAAGVELIATNPAPPVAGEYVDVTFRVSQPNTNSLQGPIRLSVQQQRFVSQVGADITSSRIEAGGSITGTIRLYIDESAPEGSINVVSLLQIPGGVVETDHAFFVEDAQTRADLVIGEIRSTPSTLLPDTDDNEIRVTLQNLGEKDAQLVTAQLVAGVQASNAYSLIDSVASIGDGQQQDLTFTIDIDDDQRESVQGVLDVRYRSQRDNSVQYDVFEESLPIIIPIDNSPYLEVAEVSAVDSFAAGTTDNVARITIVNTGDEAAEDVRVRLFPDIGFPFLFELTSQYVGAQIPPGGNVSVEVTFEILSGAQVRDYPVAVELESIVSSTRYTQDDEVVLRVTQAQSSSSSQVGMFIIAAIVVVAAVMGYVLFKRRKS